MSLGVLGLLVSALILTILATLKHRGSYSIVQSAKNLVELHGTSSTEALSITSRSSLSPPQCKVRDHSFEILLVSPGGTGSSSGFDFFTTVMGLSPKDMNDRGDKDGLKHMPFYSLFKTISHCNLRVKALVYQFDDPVEAVYSLYRRGFAKMHYWKLEPVLHTEPEQCRFPDKHCTFQHCRFSDLKQNITSYARIGLDLLGMKNHLDSYVHGVVEECGIPVVFLKTSLRSSEQVMAKLPILLDDLQIKRSSTGSNLSLSKYKRTSYKDDPSYENISSIYASFNSKVLDALGALAVAHEGYLLKLH